MDCFCDDCAAAPAPDSSPSSAVSTPRTSICSCSDSGSDVDVDVDVNGATKRCDHHAYDRAARDTLDDSPTLVDVLIIGAGPCGLAVAARLREETPSALFTDDEHQRYHWIKRHAGKMKIVQARRKIRGVKAEKYVNPSSSNAAMAGDAGRDPDTSRGSSYRPANQDKSILVLDCEGGGWLARWDRLFSTYEISHLRSPMFFHVDPRDRDGMLAYARETGRERELWELHGCVGQELSKHRRKKKRLQRRVGGQRGQQRPHEVEIDERDRKDYYCPPTSLFRDYCASVVGRYRLDSDTLVQQAQVTDLAYGVVPESGEPDRKVFTARTADGRTVYAHAVVCAVGPGLRKNLPWRLSAAEARGAVHSSEIARGEAFLPPHVRERVRCGRETDVVVVGGGLTSAQIADNLVRRGVTRVWLLMRGPLKVKHFDMSLEWVGKFRNYEKAVFWSADTVEEKAQMFHAARQGGSINPKLHAELRRHAAAGRVRLCTHTQVSAHAFDTQAMAWALRTEPPVPGFPDAVDYIYFATGMDGRLDRVGFLQTMLRTHPAPATPCGFPHLTTDLEYLPGVPLYFTGRLASMHLGPGGPNLEGARAGAERIA
ncbi:hypothetical protein KEM52_001588, partial [Ascosphaera acerosa]